MAKRFNKNRMRLNANRADRKKGDEKKDNFEKRRIAKSLFCRVDHSGDLNSVLTKYSVSGLRESLQNE